MRATVDTVKFYRAALARDGRPTMLKVTRPAHPDRTISFTVKTEPVVTVCRNDFVKLYRDALRRNEQE
jgi:hypothetical protein